SFHRSGFIFVSSSTPDIGKIVSVPDSRKSQSRCHGLGSPSVVHKYLLSFGAPFVESANTLQSLLVAVSQVFGIIGHDLIVTEIEPLLFCRVLHRGDCFDALLRSKKADEFRPMLEN